MSHAFCGSCFIIWNSWISIFTIDCRRYQRWYKCNQWQRAAKTIPQTHFRANFWANSTPELQTVNNCPTQEFSERVKNSKFLCIYNRFMADFSNTFQITLVLLFLGCTGTVCIAMLMIQVDLIQVIQFTYSLMKWKTQNESIKHVCV